MLALFQCSHSWQRRESLATGNMEVNCAPRIWWLPSDREQNRFMWMHDHLRHGKKATQLSLEQLALHVRVVSKHCWQNGEIVEWTLDLPFTAFCIFTTQKCVMVCSLVLGRMDSPFVIHTNERTEQAITRHHNRYWWQWQLLVRLEFYMNS